MSRQFILGVGVLVVACFAGLAIWQVLLLERAGLPSYDPQAGQSLMKPAVQSNSGIQNPAAPRPGPNRGAETNRSPFQWKQVEAEDYRSFLANLRKIGCPEQTIRDIISADLVQSFGPKRSEALAKRYEGFKYWSATQKDSAARAEFERKRREVDGEMNWAMKELLGEEYIPPTTSQEWKLAELDQQLSFLTPEKRNAVRNLMIGYTEIDQQVRALASSQNLSESSADRLQILDSYDRKREELRNLLTPEEFQTVEMSTSWTADNLRRGAVKFNPTREEFQVLFQEWQTYDEMLARVYASGQHDPGTLQEPLQENLRQRLGEQRAQEFWDTWWK
ncbi:MAG: hypothetical protein NTX27_00325 [Verrucomicrobia bacterium]|nr:hypothetical protein [Verrucomicrobiota bacterium]